MISKITQASPTRLESKGERVYYNGELAKELVNGEWVDLLRKQNAWIYDLPVFNQYEVDDCIKHLISIIKNPSNLGNYCENNAIKTKLYIVIRGVNKDTFPSMFLSEETVGFLANINACIDPDIYWDE